MKAAREISPELATVSLPDSYILATERMTCGPSIRPHLLRWPSRWPPVSLSWLQEESFSVPMWQKLTVAGNKCGGTCFTSRETFSGFSTGEAAPYLVCSSPGCPQCECARDSMLTLLFNSNKESRILVFVAVSTTRARILCLLVPRHQMVVGLCGFVYRKL